MKKQKLFLVLSFLGVFFTINAQVAYNYTGTGSFTLPSIIQAEDFIQGGEGVAYHDLSNSTTDTWMPLRVGTQVNVSGWKLENIPVNGAADNTPVVGWIATGEWLVYTITSATAKSYDFWVSVAGPNTQTTGAISVFTGTTTSPNPPTTVKISSAQYTAGGTDGSNWNFCVWQKLGSMAVAAGSSKMRVEFTTGGGNVNAFALIDSNKVPADYISGVNSTFADQKISVYVSNSSLTINSPIELKSVSVLDFSGKSILKNQVNDNNVTINTTGLKGMYIITVTTQNGTHCTKVNI